jgi:hypothetical protein
MSVIGVFDREEEEELSVFLQQPSGDLPNPRAHFSAVLLDNKKIIITSGDNQEEEFNDVYELNLLTNKWRNKKIKLKESIVGHKSILLKVKSSKDVLHTSGRGILTYGGWMKNTYSDNLVMLEYISKELRICPRRANKKQDSYMKGPKTTFDAERQIALDKLVPEGRRDHTFTFHGDLQSVVMIGGWNALEWHPDQTMLDIWALTSGSLPFIRVEMAQDYLGLWIPNSAESTRPHNGVR